MNITLFDIAQRFVGIKEIPGKDKNNSQIMAMLNLDQNWPESDEVAWCSAFLNYCAWLLRLPRSKSLMARSWLQVGRPINFNEAKPGFDVVVLWRGLIDDGKSGHVGLFAVYVKDGVCLLSGNQNDSVLISAYPVEKILGIRRLYLDKE